MNRRDIVTIGAKSELYAIDNINNQIKLKSIPLVSWQVSAAKKFDSLKANEILMIKSPRQVGKSLFIMQCMLYYALNQPNKVQIVISPVASQNIKIFKELKNYIADAPFIKEISLSTMEIIFTNKSIIKFKSAESKDNLRGEHCHILYVDEAAYVPDEIYNIVLPYLNTTRGILILTSTPKLKIGKFFQYWVSKSPRVKRVNVNRFDLTPFRSEEQVEEYRHTLTPQAFTTEVLGRFLGTDDGVFPNFDKCIYTKPVEDTEPYVAGIDWAAGGEDETVMTILNKNNQVIDIITWQKKEPVEIARESVKYINDHQTLKKVVVEENGIGKVYANMLKVGIINKSVLNYFTTTNKSKREIVEGLALEFQEKRVAIPNNENLVNQLLNFTIKTTPTGEVKYENLNPSIHDDMVMSLCLAVYASKKLTKQKYTIR